MKVIFFFIATVAVLTSAEWRALRNIPFNSPTASSVDPETGEILYLSPSAYSRTGNAVWRCPPESGPATCTAHELPSGVSLLGNAFHTLRMTNGGYLQDTAVIATSQIPSILFSGTKVVLAETRSWGLIGDEVTWEPSVGDVLQVAISVCDVRAAASCQEFVAPQTNLTGWPIALSLREVVDDLFAIEYLTIDGGAYLWWVGDATPQTFGSLRFTPDVVPGVEVAKVETVVIDKNVPGLRRVVYMYVEAASNAAFRGHVKVHVEVQTPFTNSVLSAGPFEVGEIGWGYPYATCAWLLYHPDPSEFAIGLCVGGFCQSYELRITTSGTLIAYSRRLPTFTCGARGAMLEANATVGLRTMTSFTTTEYAAPPETFLGTPRLDKRLTCNDTHCTALTVEAGTPVHYQFVTPRDFEPEFVPGPAPPGQAVVVGGETDVERTRNVAYIALGVAAGAAVVVGAAAAWVLTRSSRRDDSRPTPSTPSSDYDSDPEELPGVEPLVDMTPIVA